MKTEYTNTPLGIHHVQLAIADIGKPHARKRLSLWRTKDLREGLRRKSGEIGDWAEYIRVEVNSNRCWIGFSWWDEFSWSPDVNRYSTGQNVMTGGEL